MGRQAPRLRERSATHVGEVTFYVCPSETIGKGRASFQILHTDMSRRVIYFGTEGHGRAGHYPLGINCELSQEEYEQIYKVDKLSPDGFFLFDEFLGYGVPFSPDDKRGGCKTIVLVENGTEDEIIYCINNNEFLNRQFNRVKEMYNLNIPFLCIKT